MKFEAQVQEGRAIQPGDILIIDTDKKTVEAVTALKRMHISTHPTEPEEWKFPMPTKEINKVNNLLNKQDFNPPKLKDDIAKLVDSLNAIPTYEPISMRRLEVRPPKHLGYFVSDFVVYETERPNILRNVIEMPTGTNAMLLAFPCLELTDGHEPKKFFGGDKK